MSDNFADRFWSTKFWSARYFQGGEQNPGSMRASLRGSSALDATISKTSAEIVRPPNEYMPFRVFPYERDVRRVSIKAKLSGGASLFANASAKGTLRTRIETVCSVSATATGPKDYSKVDAVFWFMAA